MNNTVNQKGVRSRNITTRLLSFERSGTSSAAYCFRTLAYETIVPSQTTPNIQSVPSVCFRRFTPDGKFLIAFDQNRRDLILYCFTPPLQQQQQQQQQQQDKFVPNDHPNNDQQRIRNFCFHHWFRQVYKVTVTTASEILCREFCLVTPKGKFLILASFAEKDNGSLEDDHSTPAIRSVPVYETVTLHLVNVDTGNVVDTWTLHDDFVELMGHRGVSICGERLVVLSLRWQILHVLRVSESMDRFYSEMKIGEYCRPDDEMTLAQAVAKEHTWRHCWRGRKRIYDRMVCGNYGLSKFEEGLSIPRFPTRLRSDTGLGNGKTTQKFYSGLMHKLLVFVYKRYMSQGNGRDFFHVMTRYCMLVMLICYMLDQDHVLILLGGAERATKHIDVSKSTYFLVLYCMSTSNIVDIYDSRNLDEIIALSDNYAEYFYRDAVIASTVRAESRLTVSMLRRRKGSHGFIPMGPQSRNISPYLDQALFEYDDDRLPALDGTKAMRQDGPVKFISKRFGGLRFKLSLGSGPQASHKRMLFLFHPTQPFVISQLMDPEEPTIINFHHK